MYGQRLARRARAAAHTQSARHKYLNARLAAKHMALLKNISIMSITAMASARPTVT